MSEDIGGLIILPFIILVSIAIIASVWIGGNGGDVTWISEMVQNLAVPAIVLGLLLAGGAALLNAG